MRISPPLWVMGLIQRSNKHCTFLHDDRARNLTEAVLWHGGESLPSQQGFEGEKAGAYSLLGSVMRFSDRDDGNRQSRCRKAYKINEIVEPQQGLYAGERLIVDYFQLDTNLIMSWLVPCFARVVDSLCTLVYFEPEQR